MKILLSYIINGFGLFSTVVIFLYTFNVYSFSDLFLWHPLSMSLAFLFFMTQGILTLVSKHGMITTIFKIEDRHEKLSSHMYLQVCSLTN